MFKDGGKEEKKKNPTTSPVKCFFVRTESDASKDSRDYILHGKTIREARSIFMDVDKLPSLSNCMARLVKLRPPSFPTYDLSLGMFCQIGWELFFSPCFEMQILSYFVEDCELRS